MFTNAVLTRVSPSARDEGSGYKKLLFRKVGEPFAVDMQPFFPGLGADGKKTAHGLDTGNVQYRCYTLQRGIKRGDYVRVESGAAPKEKFLVTEVNEWENHTRLILEVFKNG